jgi:hypothetical protein
MIYTVMETWQGLLSLAGGEGAEHMIYTVMETWQGLISLAGGEGAGKLYVYCIGNLAGAAQLSGRRGCGGHDMCTVLETWQRLLSCRLLSTSLPEIYNLYLPKLSKVKSHHSTQVGTLASEGRLSNGPSSTVQYHGSSLPSLLPRMLQIISNNGILLTEAEGRRETT